MTYTALQLDGLKEIMNIGGGNAATSISELIQQTIDMRVPNLSILSYPDLYQQIIQEDVEVHAVVCPIQGDFKGVFLFIITDESAQKIAQLMMGNTPITEELKLSAVTELTNIVANSFLEAIDRFLNVNLHATLPLNQYDYFGAIISSVYMALDQYDDQIMIIRNEFYYAKERLDASLFFIPEEGVLDHLVQALGI